MTRLLLALIVSAFAGGLVPPARAATAATFVFETGIYGSEQVPPVQTAAYGFVRFFFNESRTAADYTIDVKGLATGLVLGADIHRGASGEQGPVVKHLADGGFIVAAGHLRLHDEDLEELISGNWYVSLKTEDHPDGELRGQIVPPAGFLPDGSPPPDVAAEVAAAPPAAETSLETAAPAILIRPPNTGDAGLR